MFLPLLTASQRDAAGMLGMTVYLYTGDDRLCTYTVTRVLRHQRSLAVAARDANPDDLWLQTSEASHDSGTKLLVVAARTGWTTMPYSAAHPAAYPRVCG